MGRVKNGFKECAHCKETFPATSEYFRWHQGKVYGRWKSYCMPCEKIIEQEKRGLKRESLREYSRTYRAANKETFNARLRTFRAANKERLSKQFYEKYHKNIEESRKKQNESNKRHILRVRENLRIWAANNPDKVKKYQVKWRKNNPEKIRAKGTRRRALKLQAVGTFTPQDIQNQNKRQKGKCYYCSRMMWKATIEHITPLSRGGSNDPSNIVLACGPCNSSKRNKLPHEWVKGGRLL